MQLWGSPHTFFFLIFYFSVFFFLPSPIPFISIKLPHKLCLRGVSISYPPRVPLARQGPHTQEFPDRPWRQQWTRLCPAPTMLALPYKGGIWEWDLSPSEVT